MAYEIENANSAPAQQQRRIQGSLLSPDVKQELVLKSIPVSFVSKRRCVKIDADYTANEIAKGLRSGTMVLRKPERSTSKAWKFFGRVAVL